MSLDSITHIKVFPGIGTARVGNSPEYFIGPEIPGDVPNLGLNYKDENGLLKPQAARFRVYGFDKDDNVVAEITHDPANGTTLEWDVHMRNLKAANYAFQGKFGFNPKQYRNPGVPPFVEGTDPNSRTNLIIDPGNKCISGVNLNLNNDQAVHLDGGVIFRGGFQAEIPSSLLKKRATGNTMVTYKEKEVSLGRLETDPGGRLIVVGGKGEAGCLIEPPIILQKGVSYFDGINTQLAEAIPVKPCTSDKEYTFCSKTITIDVNPQDQVNYVLSSDDKGQGSIAVYDTLNITLTSGDNQEKHCINFKKSGEVKSINPNDTNQYLQCFIEKCVGKSVTIELEYTNDGSGDQGATDIYFCYINANPTSNGNSYFNNPGWYDDTGGGSVHACVNIKGKTFSTMTTENGFGPEQKRGWVAVSPPKYTPTMNNVVSLLDLQLAMFPEADPVSGTVNFARIGTDGTPDFSTKDAKSFVSLDKLSSGSGTPSIASFNGTDYMAYKDSDGNLYIAESADGGVTWKNNQVSCINASKENFDIKLEFSPSLCVFDGALTLAAVIQDGKSPQDNGNLYIGRSTDGSTFTFEQPQTKNTKFGVAYTAANLCGYNGRLYIAYTDQNGAIVIAHNYLDQSSRNYYYTFDILTDIALEGTTPDLGVNFGRLYCAYTGQDGLARAGFYTNYTPAPAEPAAVSFNFNKIQGAPTSDKSPTIAGSHCKLYYAIIGAKNELYLASIKPQPILTKAKFNNLGPVNSTGNIAIANFSNIEFYRDVYPTLKTVTDYAWVNEPAFHGHAPGKPGDFLRENSLPAYSNPNGANNIFRSAIFNFLRKPEQLTPDVPPPPMKIPNPRNYKVDGTPPSIPDGGIQSGTLMPHLFGEGGSPLENGFNGTNYPNQWLSLTPHQLWKFQEWVNGNFTAGEKPVTPHVQPDFYNIPLAKQPAALNFSALEPTVGGGFHPGIELTYYMKEPGFFKEAFRFADEITTSKGVSVQGITPGSVAAYMSIPWQGDFWSCNISWWAAMRPDIVIPKEVPPPFIPWYRGEGVGIPANADNIADYEGGYEHMVRYWSDFGFVVPTGQTDQGMFIMEESERNPCLDNTETPCKAFNQPENALIGKSFPETNSTKASNAPYCTFKTDLLIPASGQITLAGSSDGTGKICVDDELIISMCYKTWTNETVDGITTSVLSKPITKVIKTIDFSNGNSGTITPLDPTDITEAIRSQPGYKPGTIVTIIVEYVDTYGGSRSASEFWLVYSND